MAKLGHSGPARSICAETREWLGHDTPLNCSTAGLAPPGGRALTALMIDNRGFDRSNHLHWHTDCNDHTPHLGRTRQGLRSSRPDGGRQRPRRPTRSRKPAAKRRTAGREWRVARGMCTAQGKVVAGRPLRDRGWRAPVSASRQLIRQHKAAGMRRSQAVKENSGSGCCFVGDDERSNRGINAETHSE